MKKRIRVSVDDANTLQRAFNPDWMFVSYRPGQRFTVITVESVRADFAYDDLIVLAESAEYDARYANLEDREREMKLRVSEKCRRCADFVRRMFPESFKAA